MANWYVRAHKHLTLAGLTAGVLALACLAGCKAEADEPLILDETADGTAITISPGDYFTIQLDANPSMGYLWEVTTLNEKVLALEKSVVVNTKEASRFGGRKQRQLTFQAVSQGVTRLELEFDKANDFDEDDPSLETFSLVITVAEDVPESETLTD